MRNVLKRLRRTRTAHVRRFRRWRQHPLISAITLFVVLVAVSAGLLLFLSRHQAVTFHPDTSYITIISHDHEVETIPTKEPTVGALLSKLGIRIGKMDRVEPSLDTAIAQDNLRINIYRAMPVTIVDGSTLTTTYTAAATPRSIVTDAGITLYPEDNVAAAPATDLVVQHSLGESVSIDRAIPVALNIYGAALTVRTQATTVGQLLRSRNVKLSANDTVIPSQQTAITPGMQVLVVRNGTQIVTETQSIPAPVQTVTDTSLSFGTSAVRQQGSPGTQLLTYQVERKNGVEVSRSLLQTVVTVQPVPEIIARGQAVSIPADKQAVMAQAGITPSDFPYVDYIVSHESGWCPTKLQGQIGVCPGYAPDSLPSYLGYGLGQATPGTKMSAFGADWKTNPVTQLRWASTYANGRYGSWYAAYLHWTSNHNW